MATATASDGSEPALYPKRHVAIAILLMANFMNLVDVTIVNVALPTLHDELGATPNMIEWIIAGYTFAFALFLLPAGRMGDIFGRRRLFLAFCPYGLAAAPLDLMVSLPCGSDERRVPFHAAIRGPRF